MVCHMMGRDSYYEKEVCKVNLLGVQWVAFGGSTLGSGADLVLSVGGVFERKLGHMSINVRG